MGRNTARQASRQPDTYADLIPPSELWGRVLSHGPLILDVSLPFEKRVERAWTHI